MNLNSINGFSGSDLKSMLSHELTSNSVNGANKKDKPSSEFSQLLDEAKSTFAQQSSSISAQGLDLNSIGN